MCVGWMGLLGERELELGEGGAINSAAAVIE